jgi:hypothetical protein
MGKVFLAVVALKLCVRSRVSCSRFIYSGRPRSPMHIAVAHGRTREFPADGKLT